MNQPTEPLNPNQTQIISNQAELINHLCQIILPPSASHRDQSIEDAHMIAQDLNDANAIREYPYGAIEEMISLHSDYE